MSKERHYTVHHFRDGDKVEVWVGDEMNDPNVGPGGVGFSRVISLRWRWWHINSPAERLRVATEKAQAKADKWNRQEMFLNHEHELGLRD